MNEWIKNCIISTRQGGQYWKWSMLFELNEIVIRWAGLVSKAAIINSYYSCSYRFLPNKDAASTLPTLQTPITRHVSWTIIQSSSTFTWRISIIMYWIDIRNRTCKKRKQSEESALCATSADSHPRQAFWSTLCWINLSVVGYIIYELQFLWPAHYSSIKLRRLLCIKLHKWDAQKEDKGTSYFQLLSLAIVHPLSMGQSDNRRIIRLYKMGKVALIFEY